MNQFYRHSCCQAKAIEERFIVMNRVPYSSAILLSSLLVSGFLGLGDGVSATMIFSDSSTGQLSLGLLISIGAGLQKTCITWNEDSRNFMPQEYILL